MMIVRSKEGLLARFCFEHWVARCGYKPIPYILFTRSRTYQTFLAFASFVFERKLVNWKKYIELMAEHKIEPSFWTNEGVYSSHVNYLTEPEFEDYLVTEVRKIISKTSQINQLSPYELHTWIIKKQICVLFVLFSKPLKEKILSLDAYKRDEFETFCIRNSIHLILSDNNKKTKIKQCLQLLGI